MRFRHTCGLIAVVLGLLVAACGSGTSPTMEPSGGSTTAAPAYNPAIDPADFVPGVTNTYFPLAPGTVFHYQTVGTTETTTVTVTGDTRVIMGVTCVVVHDVVMDEGVLVEDTYDWYAQDRQGNVWYLGEASTAYDGDQTSTAGSWEAGVGGALPGIVMEANPAVGDAYRQEYLAGVAEDRAEVLALGEAITIPYSSFQGCVRTKDWTDLEPEVVENKTFCSGAGQVLAVTVQGGEEREELVAVELP
jgi:hypothetical protein